MHAFYISNCMHELALLGLKIICSSHDKSCSVRKKSKIASK